MIAESTLDRLADVIRVTLGQPQARISLDTTANDIDGWDSLRHSVLLMRIEQAFDIRFVPAEVIDLDNVGDLVKVIDAKLQK
jgi:acyl carrier protein